MPWLLPLGRPYMFQGLLFHVNGQAKGMRTRDPYIWVLHLASVAVALLGFVRDNRELGRITDWPSRSSQCRGLVSLRWQVCKKRRKSKRHSGCLHDLFSMIPFDMLVTCMMNEYLRLHDSLELWFHVTIKNTTVFDWCLGTLHPFLSLSSVPYIHQEHHVISYRWRTRGGACFL